MFVASEVSQTNNFCFFEMSSHNLPKKYLPECIQQKPSTAVFQETNCRTPAISSIFFSLQRNGHAKCKAVLPQFNARP